MKLDFSRQIFSKILEHQISRRSVQCVSSCTMRTGRQTYGQTWRSK